MPVFWVLLLSSCTTAAGDVGGPQETASPSAQAVTESAATAPQGLADVVSVAVSGEPRAYRFSVGIVSPDEGCERYADWWEVLSVDGVVLYRRILLHSHVDEQPFVRSGGPVPVDPDETIFVRAHMSPGGYGGAVWQGTVQSGFEPAAVAKDFAAEAELLPPLPQSCAY